MLHLYQQSPGLHSVQILGAIVRNAVGATRTATSLKSTHLTHSIPNVTHSYQPYRVPRIPAAGTSSDALPRRTTPPWSCSTHSTRTRRQQSGNLEKYESRRMMNSKHEHTPPCNIVIALQQLHHLAINHHLDRVNLRSLSDIPKTHHSLDIRRESVPVAMKQAGNNHYNHASKGGRQ